MRNKYPGVCYRCAEHVAAGDGHFERLGGRFRVQHATCAIANRGEPDAARLAHQARLREIKASGTGKRASRARAEIRRLALLAGGVGSTEASDTANTSQSPEPAKHNCIPPNTSGTPQ